MFSFRVQRTAQRLLMNLRKVHSMSNVGKVLNPVGCAIQWWQALLQATQKLTTSNMLKLGSACRKCNSLWHPGLADKDTIDKMLESGAK